MKITNLVIEERINDKFTSRVYLGENADKLPDIIRDDVYSKLGQSLEDLNAEITNTSVYITVGDESLFYHFDAQFENVDLFTLTEAEYVAGATSILKRMQSYGSFSLERSFINKLGKMIGFKKLILPKFADLHPSTDTTRTTLPAIDKLDIWAEFGDDDSAVYHDASKSIRRQVKSYYPQIKEIWDKNEFPYIADKITESMINAIIDAVNKNWPDKAKSRPYKQIITMIAALADLPPIPVENDNSIKEEPVEVKEPPKLIDLDDKYTNMQIVNEMLYLKPMLPSDYENLSDDDVTDWANQQLSYDSLDEDRFNLRKAAIHYIFYNRKLTLNNFQKRASIAKTLYHKYNVDYDGKYLLSSFVAIENALTKQHTSINTVKPEQFTEIASDMLYSAAMTTNKHVNFDKLRNAVLAIIDYRGFDIAHKFPPRMSFIYEQAKLREEN